MTKLPLPSGEPFRCLNLIHCINFTAVTVDDEEPFKRKNKIDMSKELTNIQPIATYLKQLIEQSRQNVAVTVNAEITLLYWKIGKRINEEVLGNTRAEYGKQVVASLAQQLSDEYGRGWGEKQLRQCRLEKLHIKN